MLYVVTKNEAGEFTGFCTKEQFEKLKDVFLLENETFELFEGPEPDQTDETFEEVKRLAKLRCGRL